MQDHSTSNSESSSTIFCGWPLQQLREHASATGQRPVATAYGPFSRNPKHCEHCGQPVEYLRHGSRLLAVDVITNEYGQPVADLISDHDCQK